MAYSRDLADMDYHGLPWTTMDYHVLSWTIMDYHRLSWIIMDCHGDYHGLSWTIMDCHELNCPRLNFNNLGTYGLMDGHWYC